MLIATTVAPNLNVGILVLLAMSSIGVYGITLAGWSSGNKYSLLGGLRSSAQMISYELSLGLSIIGLVLVCGTLDISKIVTDQVDIGLVLYLNGIYFYNHSDLYYF